MRSKEKPEIDQKVLEAAMMVSRDLHRENFIETQKHRTAIKILFLFFGREFSTGDGELDEQLLSSLPNIFGEKLEVLDRLFELMEIPEKIQKFKPPSPSLNRKPPSHIQLVR